MHRLPTTPAHIPPTLTDSLRVASIRFVRKSYEQSGVLREVWGRDVRVSVVLVPELNQVWKGGRGVEGGGGWRGIIRVS